MCSVLGKYVKLFKAKRKCLGLSCLDVPIGTQLPMLVLPMVKFGMTNPVLGLGDGLLQELFLLHKAFTCGQPNEAAYSLAFAVEKTIDK
jgi:hypothetical protein